MKSLVIAGLIGFVLLMPAAILAGQKKSPEKVVIPHDGNCNVIRFNETDPEFILFEVKFDLNKVRGLCEKLSNIRGVERVDIGRYYFRVYKAKSFSFAELNVKGDVLEILKERLADKDLRLKAYFES